MVPFVSQSQHFSIVNSSPGNIYVIYYNVHRNDSRLRNTYKLPSSAVDGNHKLNVDRQAPIRQNKQ